MKQFIFTLLIAVLAFITLQLPTQAAELKSFGDVKYKIITKSNGAREVHITDYVTMKNNIVIPAKIEGLPVTEIADRAFYFDRSAYGLDGTFEPTGYSDLFIQSVTLPSTLKRIGDEAFYNHHIRKITLPSNLKEIGTSAFAMNHLTHITIPKSVQKIGGNIVAGNPIKTHSLPAQFKQPKPKQSGKLLYVTFTRNGKKEVRITGHTYKATQTKIVVPKTINKLLVTEIGDYAFTSRASLLGMDENKPLIKEVTLPSTIRKIGDYALAGVTYANNDKRAFSLPQNLEVIGDYAFANNDLTNRGNEVKLPPKLRSIGNGAFQFNSFKSITIPINVKTIGKYAFANNNLTKVTFGNGVTSIPAGAFLSNDITSLTLPKNLMSIGAEAFMYNQLPRLVLPGKVDSIDDVAFAYNDLTSVSLANVHTIGDGAFVQNKLTAFNVPSNVKQMPMNAVLDNPLQTIKFQGAETKLLNYMGVYKSHQNSSFYVGDKVHHLATDAQFTQPWAKWNQVLPARTTLYVSWHTTIQYYD
ncbi:MAG: leucine-rich repeat protein [Solibacillus sp.]